MLRIGGRKLWRAVPAIACCALSLVAIAGATNPQSYSDPVDTDPGPDVTAITVSNTAGGVVTVRLTLANRPNGLTAGDNVYVYVNTDENTSTGCAGSEYRLFAFGSPLQYGVDPCIDGAFTAAAPCCGSFADGRLTFVVPGDRIGGSRKFSFWVATAVNGNFGPPAGDYVPDSDPSGEPLRYTGGTPAPKKQHMRAQVADLPHNVFRILGTTVTWFNSFVVTKAPPGAKVVFRCCGKRETTHASSAGRAKSGLLSGGKSGTRRFHAGDRIVVSLSKAKYFPCTLHVTVGVGDYRVRRTC